MYRNYYNPQSYNYLATMWTNYQQMNLAGRLQCLVTDPAGIPQTMGPNPVEHDSLGFNGNNTTQELDANKNSQTIVENPSSS